MTARRNRTHQRPYRSYDEVIGAIDALSALDRARLDRLELRHLGGTDNMEGDLLHEAVCSATEIARSYNVSHSTISRLS
jgi:hypothetical protein